MERTEINVRTGERKVIQLTQAEIDDATARTAAETADWTAGADDRASKAMDGQKILTAIVKWIAPLVGKTAVQARQEIKAIYKGLS